jgi:predicted nucleotidyltransferase/predicted DNA-binding transcriptional regulator
MGTIVPVMGTSSEQKRKDISAALFGKTRRAILALLFTNSERSYYLREIIRELDLGRGTVQRELENLTEAGLLSRSVEGNQVHFRAREDSPVFDELKSIMVKTAGLADAVSRSLEKLSSLIGIAFIYGSIASGTLTAESDIDLLVIGEASFKEVANAIEDAQGQLAREINPSVYTETEFKKKLRSGHHFVNSVLKGPKIFVVGDKDDLARLAA